MQQQQEQQQAQLFATLIEKLNKKLMDGLWKNIQ